MESFGHNSRIPNQVQLQHRTRMILQRADSSCRSQRQHVSTEHAQAATKPELKFRLKPTPRPKPTIPAHVLSQNHPKHQPAGQQTVFTGTDFLIASCSCFRCSAASMMRARSRTENCSHGQNALQQEVRRGRLQHPLHRRLCGETAKPLRPKKASRTENCC